MENSINIARYFLDRNSTLTDKQIQKLVYYAYCWYIVKNNTRKDKIENKLFDEVPEAWIHGPVFPDLYQEMTHNRARFLKNEDYKNISKEIIYLLDMIYDVYGKYSGNELEMLTHTEDPWKKARNGLADGVPSNRKLDDKVIYEYYSN